MVWQRDGQRLMAPVHANSQIKQKHDIHHVTLCRITTAVETPAQKLFFEFLDQHGMPQWEAAWTTTS